MADRKMDLYKLRRILGCESHLVSARTDKMLVKNRPLLNRDLK